MIATIRFDLSDDDDARQHRYALAGREALIVLDEIDQWARNVLKYSETTKEVREELEHLRQHLMPRDLLRMLE